MTYEQFYYWLQGAIDNKSKLKKKDLEFIKDKMKTVTTFPWWPDPVYIPTVQDPQSTVWTTVTINYDNQDDSSSDKDEWEVPPGLESSTMLFGHEED